MAEKFNILVFRKLCQSFQFWVDQIYHSIANWWPEASVREGGVTKIGVIFRVLSGLGVAINPRRRIKGGSIDCFVFLKKLYAS